MKTENNYIKPIMESLNRMKSVSINHFPMENYFVNDVIIAIGTSSRHLDAMAHNLILDLKKHDIYSIGSDGDDKDGWIIIDFGNVIVHLMNEEKHYIYNIEDILSSQKINKLNII